MKSKFLIAGLMACAVFALSTLTFEREAKATTPTLNQSSYINYATVGTINYNVTGVGATDWVALPGQPTRTFHRICVQDTSGKTMELGQGVSPSITRQLLIPPTAGSSAVPVCYPMGLTYLGSTVSLWIRTVHGGSTGNASGFTSSGENVITFFY